MKRLGTLRDQKRWLPFSTLLKKEIRRYLVMAPQTLFAPLITIVLYLLVFGVSLGSKIELGSGYSYLDFVIPGLIIMGVINNTFANISSSIFLSRYIGNIADLLVAPIGFAPFLWAYTLAAMSRGLLVGTCIYAVSALFGFDHFSNPFFTVTVAFFASFIFAQIGFLAALTSETFDSLSMYTNFLLLPLIYLGGLFYPVEHLPGFWRMISYFNPLYYLIEGFRTAIMGQGSLSMPEVLLGCIIFGLLLYLLNYRLLVTGYKLRP